MKADFLTEQAIHWLSIQHPDATIVTEFSVSDWGGALIDVAAITDEMVVGVEIKGEGDSPTRLNLQGLKYGMVSKCMWLLVTPEGTLRNRCLKQKPKGWGVLNMVDGSCEADIRWPVTDYRKEPVMWSDDQIINESYLAPYAMIGTLWRDELYQICKDYGLPVTSRANTSECTDRIINKLTLNQLHDAMIKQLRGRVWKKPVIELREKVIKSAKQGSLI